MRVATRARVKRKLTPLTTETSSGLKQPARCVASQADLPPWRGQQSLCVSARAQGTRCGVDRHSNTAVVVIAVWTCLSRQQCHRAGRGAKCIISASKLQASLAQTGAVRLSRFARYGALVNQGEADEVEQAIRNSIRRWRESQPAHLYWDSLASAATARFSIESACTFIVKHTVKSSFFFFFFGCWGGLGGGVVMKVTRRLWRRLPNAFCKGAVSPLVRLIVRLTRAL